MLHGDLHLGKLPAKAHKMPSCGKDTHFVLRPNEVKLWNRKNSELVFTDVSSLYHHKLLGGGALNMTEWSS